MRRPLSSEWFLPQKQWYCGEPLERKCCVKVADDPFRLANLFVSVLGKTPLEMQIWATKVLAMHHSPTEVMTVFEAWRFQQPRSSRVPPQVTGFLVLVIVFSIRYHHQLQACLLHQADGYLPHGVPQAAGPRVSRCTGSASLPRASTPSEVPDTTPLRAHLVHIGEALVSQEVFQVDRDWIQPFFRASWKIDIDKPPQFLAILHAWWFPSSPFATTILHKNSSSLSIIANHCWPYIIIATLHIIISTVNQCSFINWNGDDVVCYYYMLAN